MKKTLVLFVLSMFVLLFAVGCQDLGDFADNRGNDAENELFNEDIKAPTNDSSDETDEYEEDSHPENGGENTEDNSQNNLGNEDQQRALIDEPFDLCPLDWWGLGVETELSLLTSVACHTDDAISVPDVRTSWDEVITAEPDSVWSIPIADL